MPSPTARFAFQVSGFVTGILYVWSPVVDQNRLSDSELRRARRLAARRSGDASPVFLGLAMG